MLKTRSTLTLGLTTLALLLPLGCKQGTAFVNPDRCFVIIARVIPADTVLHVGDTVTFHAYFPLTTKPCWPSDTTVAAVRWDGEPNTLTIDSVTGHVVAVDTGWSGVAVHVQNQEAELAGLGFWVRP